MEKYVNSAQKSTKFIQLHHDISESLSSLADKGQPDIQNWSRLNLHAFLVLQKYADSELDSFFAEEGFSSVRMMSPHVLHSLNKIAGHLSLNELHYEDTFSPEETNALVKERNIALFGQAAVDSVSVMITLDGKMLEEPEIFNELLQAGMTIARINLARDYTVWRELVDSVKAAEKALGMEEECKIYMDLLGPKIRVTDAGANRHPFEITEDISCESHFGKDPEIKVEEGDQLRIYKDEAHFGQPAEENEPASIGITLPEALKNVEPGDKVFFDDGKISAVVSAVTDNYLDVTITLTRKKRERIKPFKGVNFPDSGVHQHVSAITEKDMQMLEEIVPFVDLVGISFVHQASDIQQIKAQLEQYPDREIGVIAKLETKQALLNLADIIDEGLNLDLFGIMIARGDLAVEVGFDQLAKAQEDVLEICRAAHVPVIWATTVLDQLNKKGVPLRAETTDAYMGLRADCVMLNKGPYVVNSIQFLRDLARMNKHAF